MSIRRLRFTIPLLALALVACPDRGGETGDDDDASGDDDDASGDDDDATDDDDAAQRIPVPDPGDDASPGDWTIDGDHSTPDLAAPMGIFPDGAREPYLQDNNTADEDSFWVFEAGYTGSFGAGIYGAANPIQEFDLHAASDGFFGEPVDPSFEEEGDRGPFKEWPIEQGAVYVLHVSLAGGGFF